MLGRFRIILDRADTRTCRWTKTRKANWRTEWITCFQLTIMRTARTIFLKRSQYLTSYRRFKRPAPRTTICSLKIRQISKIKILIKKYTKDNYPPRDLLDFSILLPINSNWNMWAWQAIWCVNQISQSQWRNNFNRNSPTSLQGIILNLAMLNKWLMIQTFKMFQINF